MKSRALVIFILMMIIYSVNAQSFNEQIYYAYLARDMNLWSKVMQDSEKKLNKPGEKYDFAMAHYGFIGYCLGHDQKDRARPYLEKVERIADDLTQSDPNNPRYLALRGALYGLRLGYQPQLVLLIGPKVLKKVNMALENGPECPQAWVEAGNKDWWMPEIFGGSRLEALTEYETAIRLMEKDSSFIRNNWYYLNVNMMLAGFYKQAGRTFSEREIYRKMIRFEPRFGWAKEKLRNL